VTGEQFNVHRYVMFQVWADAADGWSWPITGKRVTVKIREDGGVQDATSPQTLASASALCDRELSAGSLNSSALGYPRVFPQKDPRSVTDHALSRSRRVAGGAQINGPARKAMTLRRGKQARDRAAAAG